LPDPEGVLGTFVNSCILTQYKGPNDKKPVVRPYTPISDVDQKVSASLVRRWELMDREHLICWWSNILTDLWVPIFTIWMLVNSSQFEDQFQNTNGSKTSTSHLRNPI